MVLKKFTSILNKKPTQDDPESPTLDTPEANAARGVRLFCESGSANSGEEVLHLPIIVESAVATTAAATAAAVQIRKFLSKENLSRPHVQYNAIMLIRILADNPGPSFTKNVDAKFVDTVKQLLRRSQDPSVRQILIETLNALDREKAYDTNLNELFAMWRKEQGLGAQPSRAGPRTMNAPPWDPNQFGPQNHQSRHGPRGLPPPAELAARIEEARTSAKLLLQLVQSTPPSELFANDLIKEFAGRCQSAQRSVQAYINCDSPAPDDDTMLTLIETNEQLSLAASKHQRAILQARKALGGTTPPSTTPPPNAAASAPPPSQPPVSNSGAPTLPPIDTSNGDTTLRASPLPASLQAAPNRRKPTAPTAPPTEDPFSDENETYAPPPGPPNRTYTANSNAAADHDGYNSTYASADVVSPPMPSSASANPNAPTRQRGAGFDEGDVSPIESRTAVTYRY